MPISAHIYAAAAAAPPTDSDWVTQFAASGFGSTVFQIAAVLLILVILWKLVSGAFKNSPVKKMFGPAIILAIVVVFNPALVGPALSVAGGLSMLLLRALGDAVGL